MLHMVASYLDPTLKEFRFVKNVSDRDGNCKQIKDSIYYHWLDKLSK